jgi:hypothetical protein
MVWIEYDCYACTLCRLSVSAADVVCRTTAYLWKVTVVAVRHSDEWMGYSEYVEWNSYSVKSTFVTSNFNLIERKDKCLFGYF